MLKICVKYMLMKIKKLPQFEKFYTKFEILLKIYFTCNLRFYTKKFGGKKQKFS